MHNRDASFQEGKLYLNLCKSVTTKLKKSGNKKRTDGKLRKDLTLLNWDTEPEDIAIFSYVVGFVSLLVMLLIDATFILSAKLKIVEILICLIIPTLIVPMVTTVFVLNYPSLLANGLRKRCLSLAPQAINYMIMSMRLTPSLDKAIEFTAENVDEPFASIMRKILWDVHMRKYDSVDEAFLQFAYDWGEHDEDFKRSLYAIKSATVEMTEDGLIRTLEKAANTILMGTKTRVEKFTTSLSGPTTILFTLGILLPMIIGAMLPMIALGNINIGLSPNIDKATNTNSGGNSLIQIILLMDVIFPVSTFAYASYILGKHPGTTPPPTIPDELHDYNRKTNDRNRHMSLSRAHQALIVSIFISTLFILLAVLQFSNSSDTFKQCLGSILIVIGIGFGISYYCNMSTRSQQKEREKVLKMESEFPDALFHIGSRISEGMPLEEALKKTSETMKGSAISMLFERIAYNIQITRADLNEILFGNMGVFNKVYSRTIKTTMKSVVQMVKKDLITAGQIILSIADHLKDMKKVDNDIRTQLGSTTDMMRTTSTIFAPIVFGITLSLYGTLFDAFSGIANTSMLGVGQFSLILGVYLILTVVITMYFCAGIYWSGDRIVWKSYIGNAMPVAVVLYAATALLGGAFIV